MLRRDPTRSDLYLLDTQLLLEARRRQPDPALAAWLRATPVAAIHVAASSLGELQAVVERIRLQQPQAADAIEGWLDRLAATATVLPMDADCCRHWVRLIEGKAASQIADSMVAATALVHGLTVATRRVEDFLAFGAPAVDPIGSRT
jgi:predicted nucleic acid-binding protein